VDSVNHRTIVSRLRTKLDDIPFEAFSMIPFKGRPIMSRGFFPGGNGLFEGEDAVAFPVHGTLVLGSNFGCAAKFSRGDSTLVVDDEISDSNNKTWPPLRSLLDESGIDLRECFFTNAWPCLHEGTKNTLGDLMKSWLAKPALMTACLQFFGKRPVLAGCTWLV
jgi:hypothetical protein